MSGIDQRSRRGLVLGGALGAAGLALGGAGAQAAPPPRARGIDLKDPVQALEAYVKLRGSTAAETVYVQYDGDIFLARGGDDNIALCGIRGILKSHWRPDGKGGYLHTNYDLGVFVDSKTGEKLKTWRNPLTGETVDVIHYTSGPVEGHNSPGKGSGGADDPYGSGLGRWGVVGDTIWQTATAVLRFPSGLTKQLHPRAWAGDQVLSSMSTVQVGRISDILNPKLKKVPMSLTWMDLLSPHPWMGMGDRPVMCDWRMIGAKAMSVADLDPAVIAEIEEVFPGYITQDRVWTNKGGGWNQYRERYPKGE